MRGERTLKQNQQWFVLCARNTSVHLASGSALGTGNIAEGKTGKDNAIYIGLTFKMEEISAQNTVSFPYPGVLHP